MNDQETTIHIEHDKDGQQGLIQAYCELTKIKLSLLVVMSTAVAFVMASELGIDWLAFLWTVIGTTLSAAAAATWNQLFEQKRDASMARTQNRPIPSGRISTVHAFVVGVLLTYGGLATLAFGANPAAAGVSLLTILTYVFVYTPLKPRTTYNTFIGAIVGAFPPLLGWVAAVETLSGGAWILAGILFLWQIPHFLALAWKYKDDYEHGGFTMLPSLDSEGELTGRVSVLAAVCLIPLCLLFTSEGVASPLFAIGGSLLSAWFTYVSYKFWRNPNNTTAMRMFLASIAYLPLLFILMLFTREYVNFTVTLTGTS
ncbi:MAG: protoheme IX farnesyltransferase [Planctomycetes bacterium]|nr:protoheme IX farnesyltransferase [Planctomycetota bacterium]